MKHKILYLFTALLFSFALTGCKEDDDYNPYVPLEYDKMVSSVKISNTINGKEYTQNFDFVYDAQNRIKEINGVFRRWLNEKIFCITTTQARYYYKKDVLLVEWSQSDDYLGKVVNTSGKYTGVFNTSGALDQIYSFDCEYQGMLLKKTYFDNGEWCEFGYDRYNNLITADAYTLDSVSQPKLLQKNSYSYNTTKVNKTNLDFASLLGYNIAERVIPEMESSIYSLFQLSAFAMFGSRSTHLPDLSWEFDDEGCPVSFTDKSGRKYVITYK